ncbi:MAG TPA: triose-phosphate isomerase [Candidatus Paceibacterota bacterium]|nr:triose-phosphate isomerase [Candidatus Paceibacterota bacterium]
MAKKRLVAGNWKMYMADAAEARKFAVGLRRRTRGFSGVEVFLAPPLPFIADIAKALESSPIEVGAQIISAHEDAPHTGEVSGRMLKGAGASFVIVGHSERRASGETNDVVRASLERAVEAGLTPVLCVGEREREADGEHFAFIEAQLSSALNNFPKNLLKKLVVAYEPVWAIGKSSVGAMKAPELEEMVIFVRKTLTDLLDRKAALNIRVLYGGSVEPGNASELLAAGVNGFLVGHASADLNSFVQIIQACK